MKWDWRAQQKPKIIFYLYMVQDLDTALPVLSRFQQEGWECTVYIDRRLAWVSPRVIKALKKMKHPYRVISSKFDKSRFASLFKNSDAFVTIVESSAQPHRLGYELALLARDNGCKTYTFQHGLENIGLTYFDDIYRPENIRFASETIFIWGETSDLHPKTLQETISKCVSVGSPKRSYEIQKVKNEVQSLALKQPAITIFENLHWERYSESYKKIFIEMCRELAEQYSDYSVYIKTHHAGRWSNRNQDLFGHLPPNLHVVDVKKKNWEPFTASHFIGQSDFIFTTPSTVALDAADFGTPCAVLAFDGESEMYRPLPQIKNIDQAKDFARLALQNRDFKRQLAEFAERVSPMKTTVQLIVDKIKDDFYKKISDSLKVFVGTDRSQFLAVKVLEHSIKKHTEKNICIISMCDLPVPQPADIKNQQRTGFSFSRFCIPQFMDYQKRAVYMDADMLVFKDIDELFSWPMKDYKILIQEPLKDQQTVKTGVPGRRIRQCAVMLIDCQKTDWNIDQIVANLDSHRYSYEELMYEICLLKDEEIGEILPFEWNSLEHYDSNTRLIHYTDMNTQPWVRPINKNAGVWFNEVREMLWDGTLSLTEVLREIKLGYFRPSLILDIFVGRWVHRWFAPIWGWGLLFIDLLCFYRPHRNVYKRVAQIQKHSR